MAPRPGSQRKLDTLAKLSAPKADAWVASASSDGVPHLVPLSLGWDGERLILAVDERSVTARNITATEHARLALGPTRDVVVIDAVLDRSVPVTDAPDELVETYVRQADWDPRPAGAGNVFLVLGPRRIQAWREVDELPGRTLMRGGAWIV